MCPHFLFVWVCKKSILVTPSLAATGIFWELQVVPNQLVRSPWFILVFRVISIIHRSTMIHHGPPWSTMIHHDPPWSTMIHHDPPWSTMIHHDPPWSTMIHHSIIHNGGFSRIKSAIQIHEIQYYDIHTLYPISSRFFSEYDPILGSIIIHHCSSISVLSHNIDYTID